WVSDSKTNDVLVEVNGDVMQLTLSRPDSLNAFSPEMLEGLTKAVQQANEDVGIKAILFKGSGRAFCAGGDVKQMGTRDSITCYDHLGKTNDLVMAMHHSEK